MKNIARMLYRPRVKFDEAELKFDFESNMAYREMEEKYKITHETIKRFSVRRGWTRENIVLSYPEQKEMTKLLDLNRKARPLPMNAKTLPPLSSEILSPEDQKTFCAKNLHSWFLPGSLLPLSKCLFCETKRIK